MTRVSQRAQGADEQVLHEVPARELDRFELDWQLAVLAQCDQAVDRYLGGGLAILRRLGLCKIGQSSIKDVAVQFLGMPGRTAEELCHLADQLEQYSVLQESYENGVLSKSKVRLLLRIIKPDDQAAWVERARTMTVRELEAELKQHRATPSSAAAETGRAILEDDEELPGRQVHAQLTYEQSLYVETAFEVHRRSCGADVPFHDFVASAIIEFFQRPSIVQARPEIIEARQRRVERELRARERAVEMSHARQAELEERTRRWARLPRVSSVDVMHRLPRLTIDDEPHAIIEALVAAVRMRQGALGRFLELLTVLHQRRAWKPLGFDSLAHYARERLCMSSSCVKALLHLERRLRKLPHIRAALVDGRINQSQAEQLVKVATSDNQQALLEVSARLVVRSLRERVDYALRRRSHDELFGVLQSRVPASQTCAPVSTPPDSQTCAPFDGPPLPPPPDLRSILQAARDAKGFDRLLGDADVPGATRADIRFSFWLPAWQEESWQLFETVLGEYHSDPVTAAACLAELAECYLEDHAIESLESIRKHPILDRDGWRCSVPTCTRRKSLHVHHIIFRSQGGPLVSANEAGTCDIHHQHGIHAGWIQVRGRAPDHLEWLLGVRDQSGADPLLTIRDGLLVQSKTAAAAD